VLGFCEPQQESARPVIGLIQVALMLDERFTLKTGVFTPHGFCANDFDGEKNKATKVNRKKGQKRPFSILLLLDSKESALDVDRRPS
jgi:hypothetical protein